MTPAEIQQAIVIGLPGSKVVVRSDDNTHFDAIVVAPQFAGKRLIQRHQMVYATLGEAVGREIHALSIQAHSPEEWSAQGQG
jgi:acid stress-induced BolA-like protein IbaG/YrbA